MSIQVCKTTDSRDAAAICSMASRAGTQGRLHEIYGRRVEIDRSWTVYHVFTGVPADAGDGVMTGLSRGDATDRMMCLNRLNKQRTLSNPPALDVLAFWRMVR